MIDLSDLSVVDTYTSDVSFLTFDEYLYINIRFVLSDLRIIFLIEIQFFMEQNPFDLAFDLTHLFLFINSFLF